MNRKRREKLRDDNRVLGPQEIIFYGIKKALDWIVRHYGKKGLIGLIIVVLPFLVAAVIWYNWDKVSKLPGVPSIINYLNREKIPTADPNRFSIVVARLENDPNREHERRIIHAISEFKEVQVLSLPQIITLDGLDLEEQENRGQGQAQQWLKKYRASVLIWGTVIGRDGKTGPKIYWTVSPEIKPRSKLYDEPSEKSQLRLPEVFWTDLAEILRLLISSHEAEFLAQRGIYVADQLSPFITRVRTLLNASADRPGWDSDAKASTRVVLANALTVLGQQNGRKEPLGEAVVAYMAALEEWTRERVPLDWATTQNNLGEALRILGERESGTRRLEEAVAAYRAALEIFESDHAAYYVDMTKANLERAEALLRELRT